jgi:peptidoglycan-associated lipoprotein
MKKLALVVALVAIGASACKKDIKTTPVAAEPTQPPAAPAPVAETAVDDYTRIKNMSVDEIDRLGLFGEVHYDYDSADIREGDKAILQKNAENLKKYDFVRVSVEGHCDDRGSVEYNLALGERRAKSAYDYLVSLGVSAARLKSVSYGKEVPLCQDQTEACWARNRRGHFTVTEKIK